MGTSSTRRGKNSRNINKIDSEISTEVSWQSAKSAATKFFKGSLGFGIVMQKVIQASGGSTYFAANKRNKKAIGYASLLTVVVRASAVGVKQALSEQGHIIDETKTIQELLIDYVSERVCPEATTVEDTSIREELLTSTVQFSELFDAEGFIDLEDEVVVNSIKSIFYRSLVDTLEDAFEQEVPMSIETDQPDQVETNRQSAKRLIGKKVKKYLSAYSRNEILNPDKIKDIELDIYNSVLNDYQNGDFDEDE